MTVARALPALALLSLCSGSARADVADDVGTVVSRLAARGVVTARPPRLLTSRETFPVVLSPAETASAPGCTTVVVLGAVSTAFALRATGATPRETELSPSVAGAAMRVACGASREKQSTLSVEMRSPRAVVEVVVATSGERPPDLASLLPRREPGYVPAPTRPGAPPHPGPLDTRARAFEAALKREGVIEVARKAARADEEGAGRLLLELSPGCHRIGVLGVDSPSDSGVHDIDAELTWISGDVAAQERTDSPDATLFACTAERDLGVLSFAGAAPHGGVLVLRGRTSLPSGLPEEWGREATASMGKAIAARHLPAPVTAPGYASLGVAGLTLLPVEVLPGQCYLAALGLVEGSAKLVALTVSTGDRASSAHTEEPGDAVALAFCAGSAERATLSAEVHGVALAWALGLWPLARRRLGEDEP